MWRILASGEAEQDGDPFGPRVLAEVLDATGPVGDLATDAGCPPGSDEQRAAEHDGQDPRSDECLRSASACEGNELGGDARERGFGRCLVSGAQPPEDEERREGNRRRAACRAKGRAVVFGKVNRLDRLWTLTFAVEPRTRAEAVVAYHGFVRRLRAAYGPRALLRTFEYGDRTGRLHLQVAAGFFIPKEQLAALWGLGLVDARRFRRRRKDGRSAVAGCAGYVAKYVSKAPIAGPGEHRYEVSQGFAPEWVRVQCARAADQVYELARLMGGELPGYVSESERWEDYRGPPCVVLRWAA